MHVDKFLIGIIGFILGFFFLHIILVLPRLFTHEITKILKLTHLPFTRIIIELFSYALTIIAFFGTAEIWINLFSKNDHFLKIELAKIWGKMWFIGIIVSCLIPIIERKLKRSK
ncbi:MAG: hypothetical protein GY941_16750 [Planctomycetes bacterium]|nr:hypothetical protein [Planctomycetota bacterium]